MEQLLLYKAQIHLLFAVCYVESAVTGGAGEDLGWWACGKLHYLIINEHMRGKMWDIMQNKVNYIGIF